MQQRRRSGIIIGLLALGLLAGAALTAHPVQALDALGPYYAVPAWDQRLPAATRWVVLTNWNSAAVLDKETGLVWERSPSTAIMANWVDARIACMHRTIGNRKGWRLPSIFELASLIDPSVALPGPTIQQPGHPFLTVLSAFYWSATTFADLPALAWRVRFDDGIAGGSSKSVDGLAWCVRGGMNADVY